MPVPMKNLYLAKNLEELLEKASFDKKKYSKHSIHMLCNSTKKVLEQAKLDLKENDEEKAFVLFYKFIELVFYLKTKSEFKKHESYCFLLESAKAAMSEAELLKESLIKRYALLNASIEKSATDESVKNTKADENMNARIQGTDKSNDIVIDAIPDRSITVSKLYSLMQDPKASFLILDVRPMEQFEESHIKHASCVSVPMEILEPGMTCAQLEQRLPTLASIKWAEKNTVDYVIILDWDTSEVQGLSALHPLHTLQEAIVKWDTKNPLSKPPLILCGGYKEWLCRYPMLTTKALDVFLLDGPRSVDIVDVSSVDYPDLDEALRDELGPATFLNNKNRLTSSPRIVNGWVNDPTQPNRSAKPQPLVNRLVKPDITSSPNAVFAASTPPSSGNEKLRTLDKNLNGPKSQKPEINRGLKPLVGSKNTNVSEGLRREVSAVEETLKTTEEQLDKEREFAQLCLRKELEAEESKRIELQKQEEILLNRLKVLNERRQELEHECSVMKEENIKMKKLLEAHSNEEQKDEEKKIQTMVAKKEDLMKQVEKMRRERKLKEQKMAEEKFRSSSAAVTKHEIEKSLPKTSSSEPSKYQSEKEYTVPLRDTPDSPSRGLTRSYSSPNIAQMVAESLDAEPRKKTPTVDRTLKPKFDYRSSYEEIPAMKSRNLNPTYGTVSIRPATGLRNLGNTCYMNSTIQCLSNTEQLVDYFYYDKYKQHIKRNNKHGTNGEIVDEFAVILKSLWAGQYKSFSPKDFKNTASKYIPMCVGSEQQDSHEFLVVLMDKLHADLNEGHAKDLLPNMDSLNVTQGTETFWGHHRAKNRSKISETFEGLLRSTLTCLSCRKTSNSYEVFSCLSLPIPSKLSPTLEDSIDLFLKPEKICGEGAWECPRCRLKKEAEKTLTFSKLPQVLVIQLKRFSYEGMWRRKIQSLVEFKLSLALRAESGPNVTYSLYGIVNHFGYLEGGHYTAYCKSPQADKWFKYDDHVVTEISPSEIVTSAAYLLFYSSRQA